MSNVVFFALFGALLVLTFRRPGVACGVALVIYSVEQWAQISGTLAGSNQSLVNILSASLVLVGCIAQIRRYGTDALSFAPPSVLALGLLSYCYASVAWSLFPSVSLTKLGAAVPYLVTYVLFAPLTIQSDSDLKDGLGAALWLGLISLGALLIFGEWSGRGVALPTGYQGNPLATASVAGSILIIVALGSKEVLPPGLLRSSLVIAVGIVALLVFLRSGSRGQAIAAVATVLVFRRSGASVVLMGVGLALTYMLFGEFLQDEIARNAGRWDADAVESAYAGGRLSKAQELLQFWSRRPIMDILFGLGCAAAQDPRILGEYPHVVPAEVLAEEGLVGFAIYLLMVVASVTWYRRWIRSSSSGLVRVSAALAFYLTILTFKQGSLLGSFPFFLLMVLPGNFVNRTKVDIPVASREVSGALPC